MTYSNTLMNMQLSHIAVEARTQSAELAAVRNEVASTNAIMASYATQSLRLQSAILSTLNELSSYLNGLRSDIQRLTEAIENPEQTWAWEQFRIALAAHNDGHWQDALDYVTNSIDGSGHRTGYRLEYRFHFLKAKLLSGEDCGPDETHIDLDAAIDAYEASAKYALNVNPHMAALASQMAGSLAFATGNLDAAFKYFCKSSQLEPTNFGALEGLAQVCFSKGDKDLATDFFELALQNDLRRCAVYVEDEAALTFLPATAPAISRVKHDLEKQVQTYKEQSIVTRKTATDAASYFGDEVLSRLRLAHTDDIPLSSGVVDFVLARKSLLESDKKALKLTQERIELFKKVKTRELLDAKDKSPGIFGFLSKGSKKQDFEREYSNFMRQDELFSFNLGKLGALVDEYSFEDTLAFSESQIIHNVKSRLEAFC